MEKFSLLKKFDYCFPAVTQYSPAIKANNRRKDEPPLMRVRIDFEKGRLQLEGLWKFMMAANKHSEPEWLKYRRHRIKIEAEIMPAFSIDLNDPDTEGLVFPLEGSIKEGNRMSLCSGLLVIDNVCCNAKVMQGCCDVSFYLYDQQHGDCEICFRLPVYVLQADARLN